MTARKRKRDKEDEELAGQVAEIAGVVNYMNKVSSEEIEKKGALYLNQGRMITEQSRPDALILPEKTGATGTPIPEGTEKLGATPASIPETDNAEISTTHESIPEGPEKTGATHVPIPETDNAEIRTPSESIPEKIDTPDGLNGIKAPHVLNPDTENAGISVAPAPISEKTGTRDAPDEKPLDAPVALNVSQDKAPFELFSLVRFINGTMNVLYTPAIDNRTKTFLIAVLYESVLTGERTIKVRSNDILKALGIHKKNQKKIPEEAEKAGLAAFNVKRKGGTEVTFDEKIFEPYGKKSSDEIDRLISNIYNLSIYQENDGEETKERKKIPLQETGKYALLISLRLAGFPLDAATSSLLKMAKGKDIELATAFWIYAKASSGKIKSPGAYLSKVLKNNDTGSLSGEIMEKAKTCVKAAWVIIRETYDEPDLSFLKNLAQKLLLTDTYYKDRTSLTVELKRAGRKLIDECEEILRKLPNVDN